MIKTAILGYGNIGSGVAEVLRRNHDVLKRKLGQDIEVKYVLDLRDFPGDPMEDRLVHDASVILEDEEISIVVETMGGTKPAYEFVKKALLAGKHVATSNKELVAAHGTELLAIAKQKHVNFFFEASVGGGIPIIRPLNACIVSDNILRISGILNGTTNYMLTRMRAEGLKFDQVLRDAQALGYAERNPEADVEGKDACRKIAILCSMAFGCEVKAEDIPTTGITKITEIDMAYAKELNCRIRLIASGERTPEGVIARVEPVMLSATSPLAPIDGVMNGVLVEGDISGALLFSGAGAGKLPTASAVVADVVEAALHPEETLLAGWQGEKLTVLTGDEKEESYFLRIEGDASENAELIRQSLPVCDIISGIAENEFAVVTAPVQKKELEKITAAGQDIKCVLRMG